MGFPDKGRRVRVIREPAHTEPIELPEREPEQAPAPQRDPEPAKA